MSLHAAWNVIIGVTPVPGLQSAFTVFKFIVSCVQNVRASQQQLIGLANAVGQLLATLQREFQSNKLTVGSCAQPLNDLLSLLKDIHKFLQTEQARSFLKALFHADSRISAIEMFYRRMGTTTTAFQISASLNIQHMLRDNERARIEDAHALTQRFVALKNDHNELRWELEINHKNMLAMMVSIERRMEENRGGNIPEQDFYAHAQHYLALTSGQEVKFEDWMISAFDVDYGPEIGAGGFGTVLKGTWNRTEVAIKLIHNGSGIAANVEIWMTLRHPNILQFLGANTLDDKPFVVMPLMPYNSREFLRIRPSWDPLYILRDISLGLDYLHGRKISHGDLKGINILVEDSGRALLCDFGLARIKADITSRTRTAGDTVISGTRNWMAPELFSGSLPRPPSDIYAFGMTVYELYTDETPLATIPYGDFVEVMFRRDVRPERPEQDECPRMNDGIWHLAECCWNKDAKARPTARQIHDTIKRLMLGYSREPVVAALFGQTSPRILPSPPAPGPLPPPMAPPAPFAVPENNGMSLQQSFQQVEQKPRISWALGKAEKKSYSSIFRAWDIQNTGFIGGQTAIEVFGQSGLPKNDLARIWALADIDDRGKLNLAEFQIAMGLIYRKLNGIEIPDNLPPELEPPSSKQLGESVRPLLKHETRSRTPNSDPNTPLSCLPNRPFTGNTNGRDSSRDATMYQARSRHVNRDAVRATANIGSTDSDLNDMKRVLAATSGSASVPESPAITTSSSNMSNRQSVDWYNGLASDTVPSPAAIDRLLPMKEEHKYDEPYAPQPPAPVPDIDVVEPEPVSDLMADVDKSTELRVRSLYTYEGEGAEDITFAENVILIANPSKTGGEWWYGKSLRDGASGMFPRTYVQEITTTHAKALYDYSASNSDELSFSSGDTLSIVDMSEEEEWWKAEQDGAVFLVPASYLEVAES
ncbi:Kinase-like protein [Mycena sanguinolenta]|uniref:mitogen-activated protein kinase kinase kinase n=1 Tax=Mycena sanguinolenta TaxID=230812 RepID=A0A8H7CUF9_9AGAR|nr:Kinase-like protein [Mycena sanguinolenta]